VLWDAKSHFGVDVSNIPDRFADEENATMMAGGAVCRGLSRVIRNMQSFKPSITSTTILRR